tara:strand:- start:97 stop:270 length:174 start_codon:yes stop_codon:yes gene_type:complete
MKIFIFLALILISSCSSNTSNSNLVDKLNFDDEFDTNQFILKLKSYSKNNSYPNIDN